MMDFVSLTPFWQTEALRFQAMRSSLLATTMPSPSSVALAACWSAAPSLTLSLREATTVEMRPRTRLSDDDLATLGTLGSLLPALKRLVPHPLCFYERAAGPHGVQRLAEKLGARALPGSVARCAGPLFSARCVRSLQLFLLARPCPLPASRAR